jgi:hypothetical protein
MPIHRSVTRRPHCVQRFQKSPPCDDRNPMAGTLWPKPCNRDGNHYKTVQHVQCRTACVDMRVQWRTSFHGVSCWRSRSDVERPYCRPLDKSLIWECLTKPCWDIRRNSLRRSTTAADTEVLQSRGLSRDPTDAVSHCLDCVARQLFEIGLYGGCHINAEQRSR